MEEVVGKWIVIVIVSILAIIALREGFCWYFKISEISKELGEIKNILKKIAGIEEPEPKKNEDSEKKEDGQ